MALSSIGLVEELSINVRFHVNRKNGKFIFCLVLGSNSLIKLMPSGTMANVEFHIQTQLAQPLAVNYTAYNSPIYSTFVC